ncbi:MAG: hypothetical protein A3C02_02515 [Candidatus Andersenbacteria bacterium RIFCSPHIGHO2_02_FULL_45_11]|uniref:Glycosyltransferase family 1 protein n=1 Tax=Candidatus Andersenbacteria bacterium RIFCSPHIGHO2_12_FULL_45_11 TaxID=1797281 RepID=A0A1G1X2V1_9BACT|nr:MAG: hypothetical protein A2805_00340 [Candidatus Andersenbacteria bacterium RIFCSPHIGHO2_01_FULL_46_36]OGY32421.1 MAG: hypothetical protein A3C02_02515 [Candidatus Andersenbacteria bacterium RIFCSPHIGHO2_02_FULL_45_11]OGY34121.1 MAG: hypothetical protein A3D99_01860 [Candidatus Andersenbacteria bacterium RIFCSPHIGHO2_12_FULL_45_11]
MRIAIDARAFWWTGIGRYIRNIVHEFAKDSHGHEFTLLVPEGREGDIMRELGDLDQLKPLGFKYVGVEPSYYSLKEQTKFLLQLNRLDIDLVHFTHFNVPLLYRRPYVVTIHDITRFIFPGQKSQSLFQQIAYEAVFAHAVKRARTLIAVSKTTLDDMKHLPITLPKNIAVIHEGIDPEFLTPVTPLLNQKLRLLLGTDKPYVLYVGVWMSHKNLVRLLQAFEVVRAQYPEMQLVITGKPVPGYSNLLQYVQEHGLEKNVIFPGFVPASLLPVLYANASLLVLPSLYEGFGLPPLEAAACGTPVVISNVSSMPELLQDAAEYINPESVEDISRGIIAVLADPEYAGRLVANGLAKSREYRWEITAQQHIRIYETALQ